MRDFNDWLLPLPHRHKIVIAGNHDWCFEREDDRERAIAVLSAATYLQDSGITLEGVRFYGSPWQPAFRNWAFNLERGKPLREKWDRIPPDTDVLITHGPPLNVLDLTIDGQSVGCEDLRRAVDRVKPLFHVFGHIHEGYGKTKHVGTTFINACVCTARYVPTNKPVTFEIDARSL